MNTKDGIYPVGRNFEIWLVGRRVGVTNSLSMAKLRYRGEYDRELDNYEDERTRDEQMVTKPS